MTTNAEYLAQLDEELCKDAATLVELGFIPEVGEDLSVRRYVWRAEHCTWHIEASQTSDNYRWKAEIVFDGSKPYYAGGAFLVLKQAEQLREAVQVMLSAVEALQHLYFMCGTPPYISGAHLLITSKDVTVSSTFGPRPISCTFSASVNHGRRRLIRRCANDVVKLGKYWW